MPQWGGPCEGICFPPHVGVLMVYLSALVEQKHKVSSVFYWYLGMFFSWTIQASIELKRDYTIASV